MQVLAVGLGGAGCRIVDRLYDHDRRSRIGCVDAIVVDTDVNTLTHLRHIPANERIYFPFLDQEDPAGILSNIDIEEVMTHIQRMDTFDIDAILICCGLGGNMVAIAPPLIAEIRQSYIEPIFVLATLPCLHEGKMRSAKAADDIETLEDLADATILFDNEIWYRKVKALLSVAGKEKTGIRVQHAHPVPSGTGPTAIRDNLNEHIARRVGILLRAGEFDESGMMEVAEVVLDAGELLNTLKSRGYAAIGYAVEELPSGWSGIFAGRHSSKYFIGASHQRAARIVTLAKSAVYDEISIACDLTSADKALVLIAGPSRELSVKGFQSVRKWIDRSIAGLEMRSGDYPVRNTKYVGIIVLLSGLRNIPRLDELRQIREEYLEECAIAEQEEQDVDVYVEEPEIWIGNEDVRSGEVFMKEEVYRRRDLSEPLQPDDPLGVDELWEVDSPGTAPAAEGVVSDDDGTQDSRRQQSPPDSGMRSVGVMNEPAGGSSADQLVDEMISFPGGKGASRQDASKLVDEMISLPGGKGAPRRDTSGELAIPPKPGRTVADITRQTEVSGIPAPKNSVFDAKTISLDKSPEKVSKSETGSLHLSSLPKADDSALGALDIRMSGSAMRANDGVFEDRVIRLRSDSARPSDDLLTRPGMRGLAPATRPKETVPGQGRFSPAFRPKETIPGQGKLSVIETSRVPGRGAAHKSDMRHTPKGVTESAAGDVPYKRYNNKNNTINERKKRSSYEIPDDLGIDWIK